jgi:hypothetical protein
MIARSDHAAHLIYGEADDRLFDLARACWPDRDRLLGSVRIVAKTLTEIRSLARSHTRTAINVLVGIMRSKDATAAARVSAANAILDRGWGKATQPLEHGDDGRLELIHRIEMRADFQHLRRWRKSVEQAQSYTFKAVITVIVTGVVGAIWLGIKIMLGK